MPQLGHIVAVDQVIFPQVPSICLFHFLHMTTTRAHVADLEAAIVFIALRTGKWPETSLLFDKRAKINCVNVLSLFSISI